MNKLKYGDKILCTHGNDVINTGEILVIWTDPGLNDDNSVVAKSHNQSLWVEPVGKIIVGSHLAYDFLFEKLPPLRR